MSSVWFKIPANPKNRHILDAILYMKRTNDEEEKEEVEEEEEEKEINVSLNDNDDNDEWTEIFADKKRYHRHHVSNERSCYCSNSIQRQLMYNDYCYQISEGFLYLWSCMEILRCGFPQYITSEQQDFVTDNTLDTRNNGTLLNRKHSAVESYYK